jgi:hypothetical protein
MHARYFSYIVRHKWFVFQAGRLTGASLWRLIKHDWSKFFPSEWMPYASYFYGEPPARTQSGRPNHELTEFQWRQESRARFNRAWLLHQHRNDHHWQHWVLRNDDGTTECLEMPSHVAKEMLADWMGAGRAITGKWECAEWYAKNRDKIQLHPETRAFIEANLETR